MRDRLRQLDIEHIWHPYTDVTAFEKLDFPIIDRAEGAWLYDMDGRAMLDGISSWWCVNLGHGHPRLVEAIREQASRLQHTLLGGASHPKAIDMAARLAEIAPDGLDHSMFAADGSCAVEAALKMSLQYWRIVGKPERTNFICLTDGYHGDTLGAIGVGYVPTFHDNFESAVHKAHAACSPHCAECPCGLRPDTCDVECFESMRKLIADIHGQTAAVIVEPLCQAAGGMRIYPEEYLRRLRRECDDHGLLLIADEIAVGFGRTGAMFACQRAGISPDIITIGKGLTGGYLPMSATLVTDRIYDSFRSDDGQTRTLYHGVTFCGNPITSAVALAALDVYAEEKIVESMSPRIEQLDTGMRRIGALLSDSFVQSLGMIAKAHLNDAAGGSERAGRIAQRARELGLFIRHLGSVVYLWPPLTCTNDELARMLEILETAADRTA